MPDNTDLKLDMLTDLFAMQCSLNDYAFKTHNILSAKGEPLKMLDIMTETRLQNTSPNGDGCIWISRYLKAAVAEIEEVQEHLPWKWWSKKGMNIEEVQKEIVDIWHFLISATIAAGMTPEDLLEKYKEKNKINFNRQETGYGA